MSQTINNETFTFKLFETTRQKDLMMLGYEHLQYLSWKLFIHGNKNSLNIVQFLRKNLHLLMRFLLIKGYWLDNNFIT